MKHTNGFKAVKRFIILNFKFFKKYYIKKKGYMPDSKYIPIYYKEKMGKDLDLNNPKTIAEKLHWMKLYYRDPLFVLLADKYRNRFYVEKVTGKDYSVTVLGKWKRVGQIDFDALPDKFVLKTNHDDIPILILDKKNTNLQKIKEILFEKLHTSKYVSGREWSYKNIKRCIFAEELLGDGVHELLDYKFFCFYGEVKFIYIFSNSTDGKRGKMNFFDKDFNPMPFMHYKYPPNSRAIPKPDNYGEMVALAEKLSQNIPFVRVDMFNVEGKIYVGEFTFYPSNGILSYDPPEYEEIIGSYLPLPEKNGWKKINRDNKWIRSNMNK